VALLGFLLLTFVRANFHSFDVGINLWGPSIQSNSLTFFAQGVELIFDTIKGKDEMDSTTIDVTKFPPATQASLLALRAGQNLRIGVPKEYFAEGINLEVKEKIQKVLPVWFYRYAYFSTKRLGRRNHCQRVWA